MCDLIHRASYSIWSIIFITLIESAPIIWVLYLVSIFHIFIFHFNSNFYFIIDFYTYNIGISTCNGP